MIVKNCLAVGCAEEPTVPKLVKFCDLKPKPSNLTYNPEGSKSAEPDAL